MKLEVIATNLDDIVEISKSNADRVEWASHMEKGGLTPDYIETIKALRVKNAKPLKVMIRPTDKTYNYSKLQYYRMWKQVHRFCRMKKVKGLVFGILDKENEIDINRMGRLIRICKRHGKTVTFHRAIDLVPNYEIALTVLHELGVETILTTGGTKNIADNLKILERLKDMDQVTILAGGGVNLQNCKKVSKVADEIHVGSAVRENHDWKQHIDIETINAIKDKIN